MNAVGFDASQVSLASPPLTILPALDRLERMVLRAIRRGSSDLERQARRHAALAVLSKTRRSPAPNTIAAFEMALNGCLDVGYRTKHLAAFVVEVLHDRLCCRARKRLRAGTPRPHPLDDQAKSLLSAFVEASLSGNRERLMALMAPDITMISDGGGKVRASYRPLHGIEDVLTVWASVSEKQQGYVEMTPARLNNQPALLIKDKNDGVLSAVLLTLSDRAVTHIHIVRNPDKLAGLI